MPVISLEDTINVIHSDEFDKLSIEELVGLIPTFGMNNEALGEMPNNLSEYFGKGIKMWQYPIQLAPYIKWLQTLSVKSYCEIGVRWGGNFILISEVLAKRSPNIKLYACDLMPKSEILNTYNNYTDYTYLHMRSDGSEFKTFVDNNDVEMVFIDGNHDYEGCSYDFSLFENNINTKYIVFHDISHAGLGVIKLWNEIKNDPRFEYIEFAQQYPNELKDWSGDFLGIGVLIRK